MAEMEGMIWIALFILLLAAAFLTALHIGFRAPRTRHGPRLHAAGRTARAVSFRTKGGKRLQGWLFDAGKKAPVVIIIHGWGANAALMRPLAVPFIKDGMSVFLFDARGHGNSEGDGPSTMPKFAQDALSALQWLRAQRFSGPAILCGHSIGAAAAILAASWEPRKIAGVISIASFAHPARLMGRAMHKWHVPAPLIRLALAYIEWRIGFAYEDIAPQNTICALRCPVLLAHGAADSVIPLSDMKRIASCPHDTIETLIVDGAEHDSVDKLAAHAPRLVDFARRAALANARQAE